MTITNIAIYNQQRTWDDIQKPKESRPEPSWIASCRDSTSDRATIKTRVASDRPSEFSWKMSWKTTRNSKSFYRKASWYKTISSTMISTCENVHQIYRVHCPVARASLARRTAASPWFRANSAQASRRAAEAVRSSEALEHGNRNLEQLGLTQVLGKSSLIWTVWENEIIQD